MPSVRTGLDALPSRWLRTLPRTLGFAVAAVLVTAAAVWAQAYPSSPITLVIPLTPGDATDSIGRIMGEELSKLLKVPLVPTNRPGAGSVVGTDSVVKAKKDGYTVLVTPNASLTSSRIINPDTVLYDPLKDLLPLGLAARSPSMLTVRSDAPYRTFGEMIEFAKKNPGRMRLGTAGAGSIGHFSVELINSLTGANMTMVPFKGAGAGVAAVLGGHVEGIVYTVGALHSQLKAGALRGLVTSSKVPDFPDVPTLTQLGYPQNLTGIWFAFFAPAGVSPDVPNTLVPAIEKVVRDPAIAAKLAALGIIAEWAPGEKVAAEIREEQRTLEEIAKKAGLLK